MSKHILAITLFFLAMSLPGRAETPVFALSPSRAAPRFEATACPPSAAQVQVSLTCGIVRVLENRETRNSRQLQIFVAVFHTLAIDKAPDSTMLLWGGPGAVLDGLFAGLSQPGSEALLGRRDLIAFDYRSLGYSTPNLSCVMEASGNVDEAGCVEALRKSGVDFAGYTDTEIATDANDVRLALREGPLNLWGTSYGSRVALTLERMYPEAVRSMILDGTVPAQFRMDVELAHERACVLDHLSVACAADRVCGSTFVNLRRRFNLAIPRLNENPLIVDGKLLTGDDIVVQVYGAEAEVDQLPFVPLVMDKAARGTLTSFPWSAVEPPMIGRVPLPLPRLVLCGANVFPSDTPALNALGKEDRGIASSIARSLMQQNQACSIWPAKRPPLRAKLPVFSLKPTLIFNGEYDSNTPFPEALKAQRTLANSVVVTFPGYGHVAFPQQCPVILAQQFLELQNRAPFDRSCLRGLSGPAWVTAP